MEKGCLHIFQRTSKLRQLRTDCEGEFKGQKVEDYFDSINVKHWTAHNDEMKANYTECIICTLKSSLWNYMRKVKRYRYDDMLQDMVKLYNNTLHCTISMKPSEVTSGHVEQRLWWHQYMPKESYKKSWHCAKYHLDLIREIACAFLTRHRHFNRVTRKSRPEKYLKFISLSDSWGCANIICKICKERT